MIHELPPYVEEGEGLPPIVRIGDAFELVKTLKDESIQMVCTSPPYWGLRSYIPKDSPLKPLEVGQEETPEEYVAKVADLFDLIWPKLKDNGTAYIVIGDSYVSSDRAEKGTWRKPKQKALIPHRLAIELQNRGYWVFNDLIWLKPNPLCENVRHRYSRATETILYIGKSGDPYFDIGAVKEPVTESTLKRFTFAMRKEGGFIQNILDMSKETKMLKALREPERTVGYPYKVPNAFKEYYESLVTIQKTIQLTLTRDTLEDKVFKDEDEIDKYGKLKDETGGRIKHGWYSGGYKGIEQKSIMRNPRDIFIVTTKSYHENHYAVYPPELIIKPILASSRPGDWILDPFAGSGTTGEVAQKLGRNCILFDLNPNFFPIMEKRCLLDMKRIRDFL
ncbi:MAG: site-specific DNA-methyltransferase [archaeon]|nr:site-specific DNA-methyltransferase [archaeon]